MWQDRFLRLAAEFDTYRRRSVQESDRRAAAEKEAFIRDLLPVVDNLERALDTAPRLSPDHLQEGVELTLRQMQQLLRRHGIEPEEAVGRPFDPHRQEAIRVRCEPELPDQIVLEVFLRGYRRGLEVFRPAMVVVNDLSQVDALPTRPDGYEGRAASW